MRDPVAVRGGIAQRMIVASVVLAVVIGAAFATLLLTIHQARHAEHGARHSQDVLLAAHALEQRVLDLERGERGFLLTRQTEFLDPWQQARVALPAQGRALLALVQRSRAQQARVRSIIADTHSYVVDYSVPIVSAAQRGDPRAKTIPATAEGEARIDVIRQEFGQLFHAEHRTAASTARASANAERRAYAAAAIGIAASIALVALYAGYLSRAIVRPIRRAAAVTSRLAGGDLSARLPETGVGEIGALEHAFNVMGASLERGRDELAALADEQAALRRVATLVAEGSAPDVLFAAVAAEIAGLLPVAHTLVARYRDDGGAAVAGTWNRDGDTFFVPEAATKVMTLVRQTGGAARVEPDGIASGSTVGAPIHVQGRLWGAVVVASTQREPLPTDTEERLARFTDLVSTAIVNADAQAELTASRARIVVTADEARRRFERDLHDGAQQAFVAAALRLRAAQALVPEDDAELGGDLERVAAHLTRGIDELRNFAQGIHPAILAQGGLGPALSKLAAESPVPVALEVHANGRLPEPLEVAAYYVVSEALVNTAKHGQASRITVRVEAAPESLRVQIEDDGVGGARFGSGSGLLGLKDRVEALGGRIALRSEPSAGTSLSVEFPVSKEDPL